MEWKYLSDDVSVKTVDGKEITILAFSMNEKEKEFLGDILTDLSNTSLGLCLLKKAMDNRTVFRFNESLGENYGLYDNHRNSVDLNPHKPTDDLKTTLIHELYHMYQEIICPEINMGKPLYENMVTSQLREAAARAAEALGVWELYKDGDTGAYLQLKEDEPESFETIEKNKDNPAALLLAKLYYVNLHQNINRIISYQQSSLGDFNLKTKSKEMPDINELASQQAPLPECYRTGEYQECNNFNLLDNPQDIKLLRFSKIDSRYVYEFLDNLQGHYESGNLSLFHIEQAKKSIIEFPVADYTKAQSVSLTLRSGAEFRMEEKQYTPAGRLCR